MATILLPLLIERARDMAVAGTFVGGVWLALPRVRGIVRRHWLTTDGVDPSVLGRLRESQAEYLARRNG